MKLDKKAIEEKIQQCQTEYDKLAKEEEPFEKAVKKIEEECYLFGKSTLPEKVEDGFEIKINKVCAMDTEINVMVKKDTKSFLNRIKITLENGELKYASKKLSYEDEEKAKNKIEEVYGKKVKDYLSKRLELLSPYDDVREFKRKAQGIYEKRCRKGEELRAWEIKLERLEEEARKDSEVSIPKLKEKKIAEVEEAVSLAKEAVNADRLGDVFRFPKNENTMKELQKFFDVIVEYFDKKGIEHKEDGNRLTVKKGEETMYLTIINISEHLPITVLVGGPDK